ncbi:MAG: hypothetical protein R6U21_02745 [Thermoplasmatota archaeon]
MGFSLSASFAIIGVSILLSLEIISGGILPQLTEIHESQQNMIKREITRSQTDFSITHVTTSINGSTYDYNITIENSGSETINVEKCMLLINGSIQEFIFSDAYLFPEKQTNLTIYNTNKSDNPRIKITTSNMVESYYHNRD